MNWRMLNMADTGLCPDLFKPLEPDVEVVSLPANQAVLVERIQEFDAYFASLQVQLNQQVLERATRLRAIVTASTGLDHIDLDWARQKNITVISLKNEIQFLDSITATAEMAWCLLLATVRRLPPAFAAAREGRWARDEFRGHQLAGKTLGVWGYGRLGRMVAEYGKAFRMRVLACDLRPVVPRAGIEMVDLETLLQNSDVLSIHIHLTDANRKLVNPAAFAKMKQGAVLINTSRGAIIDEAALVAALDSGKLSGAGLDVIDGEWNPHLQQHPLIQYSNTHDHLIISPHLGGVTVESQEQAFRHSVEQFKYYLENRPPNA